MKQQITGMPKRVQMALLKVIVARANWQTVNDTDNESKAEILSENVYIEEESGERITEPRGDFMMSESDFTRYCELVYARNLEKGLDSGGAGTTFWDVKKAMFDAEDAIIQNYDKNNQTINLKKPVQIVYQRRYLSCDEAVIDSKKAIRNFIQNTYLIFL